jgi:hypothetical protein
MSRVKSKQLFGVLSTSITGSLNVSGSITSTDVIYATTFSGSGAGLTNIPSSAIVGGIGGGSQWTLNGTTLFTSQSYNVQVTGSMTVIGNTSEVFIVNSNVDTQNLFKVTSDGIVQLFVHAAAPTSSANYGQMYFTSSSLYLGLL